MEYFRNCYYLISHGFLLIFIYLFIVHRFSRARTVLICLSAFLVLCATDILKLNLFPDSKLCYAAVTVFQIVVTQATALMIARERNGKVLFLGLSASNYVIAGSIMASILQIYTENEGLALAGSLFVHAGILVFLHVWLRDTWLQTYERKYIKEWWGLCLIPVFFYCGFSFLAFFPHTLYEIPDNIPGVMLFILTMFVSYAVVLRYVKSESKRTDIYWKNVLFKSYIKGLENQYNLMEQSERNLKILSHDVRHYSGMILSLLEQGEYGEIRKVIGYIEDVTRENKLVRYCDNLIINTVLMQIMERARSLEVRVRLDAVISREIPVNEYEFAPVVANLLENALNCVKEYDTESRCVEGKIHCVADHLLLHIENPCDREIWFDGDSGLPLSTRGEGHGLGMQSVSSFAERTGGSIDCRWENGSFSILLFAKF